MSAIQTLEPTESIKFPSPVIYSDEPQVETDLHLRQILLLLSCLEWYWSDRQDFFASGNITIYFSRHQKKSEDFRGPDFFVVKDTERKTRPSWVVWEENGKYPNVIVEILSDSTAKVDRTEKKQLYQDIFRTPDYFWFEPNTLEFGGFNLKGGKYEAITPNEQGWLYSQELELYLGVFNRKLRYFTPDGILVLTPEETAVQKTQEVQVERTENIKLFQQVQVERAEKLLALSNVSEATQKISQLEQKLRELGIDPNSL